MLNIVVPMAGSGKKFVEKGYTFPKPLIEISGEPMIQRVVKNLTPKKDHRFIFVCRREHYEQYKLGSMLQLIAPNCKVVISNASTEGAVCTVLLAKEHINTSEPLIIANSDQFVDVDINQFINATEVVGLDGLIMTFKSTHPKWSFVKLGADGFVMETAEKNPISNDATVGIYYYTKGSDFVFGAENMIRKDIRTNNEFYVCPVFNELILQDKKYKIFEIGAEKMYSWGTPEDLDNFLKNSDNLKKLK
jgi:NDP-sugar pyrophosphorylase family protein